MKNYIFFLCILQIIITKSCQMIEGWYVNNNSGLNNFPWEYYTHIHNYEPVVDENGFAHCDKNNTDMINLIDIAHKHDTKFIWGLGLDLHKVLWENNETMGNNYLSTIGKAMDDCNIDGIEADYEWGDINKFTKIGIVNHERSTIFTTFLSNVKKNINPNKTVSCDVGVEGINGDSFPLEIFPWINVTMLNNGDIDYINLMSYHWRKNDINPWEHDIFMFHKLWGIDKNRINLGIGFYHIEVFNNKNGLKINKNIAGKLGMFIKNENIRGAFIFASTYDNYTDPLIKYVYEGMNNI